MIKYKWYRWLKMWVGYRSFVKGTCYLLIKGKDSNVVADMWILDGFSEEWPLYERNN